MNLEAWCQAAYQVSKDYGWHDDPDDGHLVRRPIRIALLHSEVSELLEAFRKDPTARCDKSGLVLSCAGEELADIVLRLCDYVVEFRLSPDELFTNETLSSITKRFDRWHPSMAEQICTMHVTISRLLEFPYVSVYDLMLLCARFAVSQNIDLEHAVRTKHEYNKTRAHRHGGKAF